MSIGRIALVLLIAGCAQQQTTTQLTSTASTDRPATKDEITAACVEKTAEFVGGGVATYAPDGKYTFASQNFYNNNSSTGKYTISTGRICVAFEPTGGRCDQI
jgi:hypothetical protein